ncbi:hypothetical protein B9Z55_022889 [Caenorhabditis nigoni]|uniref:Uncharacterized protein n=1 Tax=Caenorhabditis nigoni TaxID=1611254 RepID=A0A2G5SMQ9_9PELO|nr:hypothetical protein B9Z55_022889 [Caenorhabditis nigoni]
MRSRFVLPQYEIVSLNTTFSGITVLSLDPPKCHRYVSPVDVPVIYLQKETQTEKDVMLGGFLFKSRRNDGSTEKLPKCDRYKSEVARASLEDLKGRVILDVCAIPQYEIISLNTTLSGFTVKDLSVSMLSIRHPY